MKIRLNETKNLINETVTWILKWKSELSLSRAQINNAFSACSVLRADDHVTKRILFKEDLKKKKLFETKCKEKT